MCVNRFISGGVGGTVSSGIFVLTGQIVSDSRPDRIVGWFCRGRTGGHSTGGCRTPGVSADQILAGSLYPVRVRVFGRNGSGCRGGVTTLEYGWRVPLWHELGRQKVVLWFEHLYVNTTMDVNSDGANPLLSPIDVRAWLEPDIGGGWFAIATSRHVGIGSTTLLYAECTSPSK
jgi:hypothetical protein